MRKDSPDFGYIIGRETGNEDVTGHYTARAESAVYRLQSRLKIGPAGTPLCRKEQSILAAAEGIRPPAEVFVL